MSKTPESNSSLRHPTGVPRLDILLKGGFYRGAVYVVQGAPGLGKTILANQVCFNAAKKGQNSLFFSFLAESSGKLISYLDVFDFVDKDAIATKVQFASGYKILKQSGVQGVLELLKKSVQEQKAKILVIDGLDSIEAHSGSDAVYREFIHSLQAFVSLTGCTTLLLTPQRSGLLDSAPKPEQAISDGVIELSEFLAGPRAIREIQIVKFRGSDFLKGKHEIEVNSKGIVIHPRTEVQFGHNAPVRNFDTRSRMKFGIPKFDEMTHGGVFPGSMTTLLGAPGAGKTTLGLTFLVEGAKNGEPGVYFGFYESPAELIAKAEAIGIPLGKYVKSGLIEIQWQQEVENITDALAERLLERIRTRKKTQIRVFIDGMSGFRKSLAYPNRFGAFVSALTSELRNVGASTIYSEETDLFGSEVHLQDRAMASVVDNVFYLRYVELRSQLYRLISILKMRSSGYDSSLRELKISENGIAVSHSFDSAESILTGTARIVKNSKPRSKKASVKTGRKK